MYRVHCDGEGVIRGLSVIDAFYIAQSILREERRVFISRDDHQRRWFYMRENGVWEAFDRGAFHSFDEYGLPK